MRRGATSEYCRTRIALFSLLSPITRNGIVIIIIMILFNRIKDIKISVVTTLRALLINLPFLEIIRDIKKDYAKDERKPPILVGGTTPTADNKNKRGDEEEEEEKEEEKEKKMMNTEEEGREKERINRVSTRKFAKVKKGKNSMIKMPEKNIIVPFSRFKSWENSFDIAR